MVATRMRLDPQTMGRHGVDAATGADTQGIGPAGRAGLDTTVVTASQTTRP